MQPHLSIENVNILAFCVEAQYNLFLFLKHAAQCRRQQDRGINFRIDSFIQRPLLRHDTSGIQFKEHETWRRRKNVLRYAITLLNFEILQADESQLCSQSYSNLGLKNFGRAMYLQITRRSKAGTKENWSPFSSGTSWIMRSLGPEKIRVIQIL